MTAATRGRVHLRTVLVASALGALAGVGWFTLRAERRPAKPAASPYAFDMCVARAEVAGAPTTWDPAVLAGVARALTAPEREALEEALAAAVTRWESRVNPLLEDLDGGDPDAPLVAWLKSAPSFVRTAQTSARTHMCTPDGFCVRARARGAACPAGSGPPASADEEERARFVLWAWGHAHRFRAASSAAATDAAAALRERARASDAIAVVLTAEDAAVTKLPPFVTLRERWTRLSALRRLSKRRSAAKEADEELTVTPAEGELIVLPRIGAIASTDPDAAVEREVLAAAPQLVR